MNIKLHLVVALVSATAYTGQGQAVLQFSANSYTTAESAGSVTLTVQRSGDTNGVASVDFVTADGTATNALNYTAVSGNLAFENGVTNKTIVVPILNDGLVQGTRNFRVILSNPSAGAVLGARTNATVSITNNDFGIQFQFATNSVAEDAGSVMIGVVRGDDGTHPVVVDFFTTDLTAQSGLDYTGATNIVSLKAEERFKLVPVTILNNAVKQLNRTFRVTLANPVNASLGSQKTATVTIVDNDQGFRFEFAAYSVVEDAGAALINVLRGTDDTNSAVTVDCATSDFSATNGVDYHGLTNTLAFAPGDKVKQVAIPILNNGIKQAARNFRLTLSNPTGGSVLGSPTNSTVSISDNDPGVGFEQARYVNAWGSGGGITVTVLRGNDWALGPITVDYATVDGSAVAGQDYQTNSGTLQFRENETVKTLTIPLLHDRATGGPRNFTLRLSNPTGGATLGTPSIQLSIVGAYFDVAPPFDTALTIQQIGPWNTLTWAGGGQLQRADSPSGPWQTLTTATNPCTVQSPLSTTFYRVARPRPVNVYVPSSYDGHISVPLVILLHGLGVTPAFYEGYMQLQALAEARGFLYCDPESTINQWGQEFWASTDACCDFANTGVDDAGYLRSLIEEISREFAVDQKRVYLIGHSNGGFMAYRMACESADLIAGIASLAGMTFLNPSNCAPSQPVNILHIHSTADENIPYAGGAVTTANPNIPSNMPPFPGPLQTVQIWAAYNGASGPETDPAPSLDLTTDVAGLDTVITRYTYSPPGGAVELWTINGAIHTPTLSSQFSPKLIDWLLAHPKP